MPVQITPFKGSRLADIALANRSNNLDQRRMQLQERRSDQLGHLTGLEIDSREEALTGRRNAKEIASEGPLDKNRLMAIARQDPQFAQALQGVGLSFENTEQAQLENERQMILRSLTALRGVPPEQRPKVVRDQVEQLTPFFRPEVIKLVRFDGDTSDERLDFAIRQLGGEPPQSEGFTLSEGQTRFDASGAPIASTPKTTAPANVARLRNSYLAQTKSFQSINEGYGRIQASTKNPSPAGDIALLFGYMRLLDPASTVREGEFATAQEAGSVNQRVVGLYNRVISGERLTASQREDFLNQSRGLYQEAQRQHSVTADEFSRIAEKSGIDPSLVVVDRNTAQEREHPPQFSDQEIQAEMQRRGLR